MTSKATEKIKEVEKQRGRPLSAYERLNVLRGMPTEDESAERMRIILEETLPGIEAFNTFHAKVEAAKLSSGVAERHKAAHWWEATKRDLLKRFNNGEIERLGPQKEAA